MQVWPNQPPHDHKKNRTLDSTTSISATGSRFERRKQARPGELLEAALALFVEKGFAATRVDEVAARAGVSKGTLFLYFSTKEDLLKAVVREVIAGRFAEWGRELDSFEGSTEELLRYCMQVWWRRVGDTPAAGISKLMLCEAQNFPELSDFYRREVIEPGNELVGRILRRGVERGELRIPEMQYAVKLVLAPMLFLSLWEHAGGLRTTQPNDFDQQRFLSLHVEALLHGWRATPSVPSPAA